MSRALAAIGESANAPKSTELRASLLDETASSLEICAARAVSTGELGAGTRKASQEQHASKEIMMMALRGIF